MSEQECNLRLLDDLPAAKTDDKFHHEIYASIIQDVFLSNKPGMSIGLFGKWGQGKSSIVRALKESLKGEATVVVFNAWKASGDSIRRQLLLTVLKAIKSKHVDRLSRFTQTMLPFEFWKAEDQAPKNDGVADAYLLKSRWLPWWAVICGISTCASFLLVLVSAILLLCGTQNVSRLSALIGLGVAIGGPSLAAIVKWWQIQNRLLLAYTEPVSDSQKLKYPEQFQNIFTDEVSAFCKASGKLIVVVDDLDRCNAATVAEALAAIRQFTTEEITSHDDFNCQFLIPCDEQQVVLALESAGHDAGTHGARYHDYQSEELLRKFFDVIIRMDEMLPDDLSDFAADLAGQIGLEEKDARELIDIAGARDPRQIKKLLNALRVSHESVERRAGKLLPQKDQMAELAATQRLLVALRETVPEAYKRIAVNPAYVSGIPISQPTSELEDTEEPSDQEQRTDDQTKRANLIIGRAGSVSEVTAMQLIYGRLDPELRAVSTGGLLTNAFMTWNEEGFSEALAATRKEDLGNAQKWLKKKIRRTKSDAAAKDILRLMLGFSASENEGALEKISPCIDTLFLETESLREVFAGFKRYNALEIVWPHTAANAKDNVITAIFSNFEKDRSKADHELSFLLEHAKELNKATALGLKAWMVEEANGESEEEAFVKRMHSHLRGEAVRKACHGFAPEVAVVLAGKSEWMDDAEHKEPDTEESTIEIAEDWPRCNVVSTLVGDSEDHAERCLAALFTEKGQLARPLALTGSAPGFEPAWKAVGRLLSLVSDEQLQKCFEHIQNWLTSQSQAVGLESILDELAFDAYRLSAEQISWLGSFLAKRLQSQPLETYVIDFIDKSPDDTGLREGWKQLVLSFVAAHFAWLKNQPTLSPQMAEALERMHQLGWIISEPAEALLIHKLQAPNVSAFDPWLNALTPLVANRRTNLREAVKGCIEQNQRVKQALAVGTNVLWKNEVDAEPASTLGAFFVEHQSVIPQYSEEWDKLRDVPGANRVLETMRKQLPSEAVTLVSYRHALEMIVSDCDKLTRAQNEAFIDENILLLFSEDAAALQMGIEIANQLSSISKGLQRQLKELQKRDDITEAHKAGIGEILEKDTL